MNLSLFRSQKAVPCSAAWIQIIKRALLCRCRRHLKGFIFYQTPVLRLVLTSFSVRSILSLIILQACVHHLGNLVVEVAGRFCEEKVGKTCTSVLNSCGLLDY